MKRIYKSEFVRGLAKASHHYEISNLYEMGFDSAYKSGLDF